MGNGIPFLNQRDQELPNKQEILNAYTKKDLPSAAGLLAESIQIPESEIKILKEVLGDQGLWELDMTIYEIQDNFEVAEKVLLQITRAVLGSIEYDRRLYDLSGSLLDRVAERKVEYLGEES